MVELETGTGWAKSSSSSSLDFRKELIQEGAAWAVATSADPAPGLAPRPGAGLIVIPGGGGCLPRPLPMPVPLGPTTILPPRRPRPRAPPGQPPRMGARGPLPLGGIGPLGPLPITAPGCGGMGPPRPPPRIILPGIGPLPSGLGCLLGGGPLPPLATRPLGKGLPDPHWGQQGGGSRGSRPDRPAHEGARLPLGLFDGFGRGTDTCFGGQTVFESGCSRPTPFRGVF